MEEIQKLNGEQPQDNGSTATAEFDEIASASEGSPLGKFKDANSLLNAYNNLQSEFTKKCQKLSELEKLGMRDNASEDVSETPCYLKEDWHSTLAEFLNTHKSAKVFVNEIAEEISKDKVLACGKNPLNIAYAKVLDKHYKTNEELFKDDKFLNEYLKNNPQIVNDIVKKYLAELPKTPRVMAETRGCATTLTPAVQPKDLNEAMSMAQLLFK